MTLKKEFSLYEKKNGINFFVSFFFEILISKNKLKVFWNEMIRVSFLLYMFLGNQELKKGEAPNKVKKPKMNNWK